MTNGSKPTYLLAFAVVLLATSLRAQYGQFEFSAQKIPTYYSWQWLEYDCENTFTEHSGSDTILYSIAGSLRLSNVWANSDTIRFEGYDKIHSKRATLDIALDKNTRIITYLSYDCGSFSGEKARSLSLTNMPYAETESHITVHLSGNALSEYNFTFAARDHWWSGGLYDTKDYKSLPFNDAQSSLTLTLDKQYFSGLSEPTPSGHDLYVYPIPTAILLHVNGIGGQTSLGIVNALGKKVLSMPCTPGLDSIMIDVSSLPGGQYWMRVGTDQRKFVILR